MPPKKMNLRKCSLPDCPSTDGTNAIYNFPKNKKLKRKWVKMITYSNPEFAKKDDSEIMKLGVCDDHFMFDQFDDDGKKKRNAYPSKITQQEVLVGVPIISYDSDSDVERKINQSYKPPIPVKLKEEYKINEDYVCRLCLATNVKMFSLNMEPVKQYYQFIEPCIDELERLSDNNFPTTVCYLCVNSLKKCYEFGKMCAQSQSILIEFHMIYSKINAKEINDYDKSHLFNHHNYNTFTLPNIFIEDSKENQQPLNIVPPKKLIPLSKAEVQKLFLNKGNIERRIDNESFKVKKEVPIEIDVDMSQNLISGDVESPAAIGHEVMLEEDNISVEYLDQEILEENELEFVSVENINLPANEKQVTKKVTLDESLPESTLFGNLSVNDTLLAEPIYTTDDIRTSESASKREACSSTRIEENGEAREKKKKYSNPSSTLIKSPGVMKPIDDVIVIDVKSVPEGTLKETPFISQSQIDILKKSVLKSHGEVEVDRIFYQGDDIHVVMVNAEKKQVLLMLSRADNLTPVEGKAKQPPSDLVFSKHCWNVKVLSNHDQWVLIQNRRRSLNYLRAPFKCTICFRWFQVPVNYNAHMEMHDPSSGKHCCQVCKLHFAEEASLLKHQRTHTKLYSCKMCPATFHNLSAAKEHQRTHIIYECSVCSKRFRYLRDFDKHAYEHSSEASNNPNFSIQNLKPLTKYGIDYVSTKTTAPKKVLGICCGIQFDNKVTYKRHFRVNHPEQEYPLSEEGVICELCGKRIYTQGALLVHKKARHDPDHCFFKCKECDKTFRTKPMLQRHRSVHVKSHTCLVCTKKFKKKSLLKQHLMKCDKKEEESVERPFACDMCGRRFFKNCTLQSHILTVHMRTKLS